MGTSAPSMLRARVVAETGSPAGMTGSILSRGGGRSPAWLRGSRRWGSDLFGESTPPAEVSFARLASGFSFACGLTSDETLDCWGANNDGRSSPPSGNFIAVMAGGEIAGGHACAIDMEGKLICWGFAGEQEDRTTPPEGTFKQVSGGAFHNCALKTDNTAACWGANDTLQATPPAGTFRDVSAGRSHSCGLRTDGSVACWGWNAEGQTDVPAELL